MSLMNSLAPASPVLPHVLMVRRVSVIFNPTSGRRRRHRLASVCAALERAGCAVTIFETAARGDAQALARAASRATCDRLVAAGGDGTINEVINGVSDPDLPLAIVPLGTANVLAAEIGLTTRTEDAVRTILQGTPRRVFLGRANGRKFAMMAGAGFDALAVTRVNLAIKRRTGKFAYVLAGLQQLWHQKPTLYDVEIDGQRHRAASVIVAKGHFYAGRYVCAPAARLDDPRFQVCLFKRPGRWNVLRYASALSLGRLHTLADVEILPATRVRIAGPPGEPVQSDGDIIAHLPVAAEIVEAGLLLMMPPDAAATSSRNGSIRFAR
jgi:diacylglycerol kinase (ATP)